MSARPAPMAMASRAPIVMAIFCLVGWVMSVDKPLGDVDATGSD
jgi:hypothetical protein